MQQVTLGSDFIPQVDYDVDNQQLDVHFVGGEIRRFIAVPSYIFLGLTSARSPRKFYETLLRDGFASELVTRA